MSLINILGLSNPSYGNYAKGILYVICEVFWKIMHAAGNLIDAITGLFYKLTGANYLGSGSETLVEEQDLLSQIFNQNIVSTVSLFMMLASFALMVVFGVSAVVKQMYFSKDEGKGMVNVIKNMILAFIFLICLTPISLFAISSISTIATAIIGLFGDNSNVSLADLMFNISFSGNPVDAYNTLYETEISSWVQMENNLMFDVLYGETSSGITFYWYIYLIGGGVVLYNLILIVLGLVKRIFTIIILYLIAPIHVSRMVDDGGVKFREWKNKALGELISIVGTVISFMILISLVGVISDLELFKTAIDSEIQGVDGGLGSIRALVENTEQNSQNYTLMNNLTKMLLLMAGTIVAKDSGEMFGNVFKGANDDSGALLEGIFNRIGSKENQTSGKNEQTAPRTRVITKNTTSTRKVIEFSESIPSSFDANKNVNYTSHQHNNINTNVSNVDRRVNNIQNRTNVALDGAKIGDSGAKSGNYRSIGDEANSKPTDILNQGFVSSFKQENDKLRNEWNFLKSSNTSSSNEVVKEFQSASKDLDSSISSGEQNRIKNSMTKYVDAYKKEEKVAKEGYKEFAGKSTKLSNDLSVKQQDELRKISSAYKKAQVDYSKTARKLSEVSKGNMSAADALRVKERADKQREKLMEASSRASDFYNNQKKGV